MGVSIIVGSALCRPARALRSPFESLAQSAIQERCNERLRKSPNLRNSTTATDQFGVGGSGPS